MTMIKLGLVDRDDKLTGAPYDDELKTLLLSAAPIYRKYWWPTHDAGNRAWIEDAVRRTTKYAPAIVARLTTLYGVPWFGRPVRVDVVRFGKSQGAYTSNNPTHIVVASSDPGYAQWSSVEMLFHESSHGLFRKTQLAIEDAANRAGKMPRDLWHVVLFYIAGEVTRQELAKDGVDYKPYLYATRTFDGPQLLPELAEVHPFQTAKDYDNWIARINASGAYIDQWIVLLGQGAAERRTQPRVTVAKVLEQINYYTDPIPKTKLQELLRKSGMKARDLLRTKEDIYKKLKLGDRDLSESEIIDLMVEHPDLIQRPIVEKGNRAILARPAERLKEIL